jgi:translocation and assembly module TamA
MNFLKKTVVSLLSLCLLISAPLSWAAGFVLHTEIQGAKDPVLNNINERLALLQKTYGTDLTEKKIESFTQAAPNNIKQAVEPYGYFRSEVVTHLYRRGDVWTAHFDVQLGPALLITQVALRISGPGKDNKALQKFITDFPIRAGQVFLADKYEEQKQKLFQTAADEGYLKAFFEDKVISIDLNKYNAVIVMHLNTGPRYYFGKISYQQKTFAESFLRRFQHVETGDPYSSSKLLTFQQNLNDSHYFDSVSVNPQLQNVQDYQVPVDVTLKPNKPEVYNAGIGYGTYTGPRLTLGTEFRHLTKTGHHFSVQVKLSSVLSGISAQYIIPGSNPLIDQYAIGANYQKFSPKNGYSNSKSVSLSYIKEIWGGWKRTLTLSYLRENYFINGSASSHNSRLLIPSMNMTRVQADNLINPTRGYKISFDLRGASTHVVSDTRFIQSELKGKYIFSPTEASRLLFRGDIGYTSVSDLTLLPLSLQFFAGGLDSVRGFPYSYFGPGRYLKTASAEFQHRIVGNWSGAVFFDTGTADDHFNAPVGRGAGVGVIYNSLIGPVRLYTGWGKVQDKPRHFDLEFSIGPELG